MKFEILNSILNRDTRNETSLLYFFFIAFSEQYYLILESKKEIENFIFALNFSFGGNDSNLFLWSIQ